MERARVTDVMEGWNQPGGSQEFERGLRKVAQRGGTFILSFFPVLLVLAEGLARLVHDDR